MIFEDHLIEQGEAGGKEAAGQLWAAVRDYIRSKVLGLSSDYKIVTRVYANLKGLGETCHRAGIIISPNIMEEFVRGFTGSKQLFDFIDVGSGKDRADDKICGEYTWNQKKLYTHGERLVILTWSDFRDVQVAPLQLSLPSYNLWMFPR